MENWIGAYHIGNGVRTVWATEGLEDLISLPISLVGCDPEKTT